VLIWRCPGTRDESYWSISASWFSGVCWACIRFQSWKTDTGRPVLLRVEGPEAYAAMPVSRSRSTPRVQARPPEDFEEPMWVAAQSIAADFNRLELSVAEVADAEPGAAADGPSEVS